MTTLAYIVSSHGFGHAARTCAVIESIRRSAPWVTFEVFTGAPRWFFEDSLGEGAIRHHEMVTDLGLVQANALDEDLTATLLALEHWAPPPSAEVRALAARLRRLECDLVLCDISPLGLAAAREAKRPSVLVENFTWSFIYRGYPELAREFTPYAEALEEICRGADHHFQTEPFCTPSEGAWPVAPVSRRPRRSRKEVRQQLGIPEDDRMVLVTMGGIEWDYSAIEGELAMLADGTGWLVVPGGSAEPRRQGRLIRLPHRSEFYHPDLVHAADGVVGKLGYSTIAEVWSAGVPFAYVPRPRFPESPPLETWVADHLPHLRIPAEAFVDGSWLRMLHGLFDLQPQAPGSRRGAEEIAAKVLERLPGVGEGAH